MLKEIRTADQALVPLRTGKWFYWAPGDTTKYRAVLLQAAPTLTMYQHHVSTLVTDYVSPSSLDVMPRTVAMLVVQVAEGVLRNDSLVINAPEDEFNRWNPMRWIDRGFPPGWWAGVRPLLAMLEWTEPDYADVKFHHDDNDVFTDQGLVS